MAIPFSAVVNPPGVPISAPMPMATAAEEPSLMIRSEPSATESSVPAPRKLPPPNAELPAELTVLEVPTAVLSAAVITLK